MKRNVPIITATAIFVAVVVLGFVATATPLRAAEPGQLPGMCNGRKDADVVLNAHANPASTIAPKFILNLTTDSTGTPSGALILGQGKSRLYVDDWCRLWQHQPGDVPGGGDDQCHEGEGDDPNEPGTVTAHAVGLTRYQGEDILVRVDVRRSEGEAFFRVRYRVLGDHGHESGEELLAEEDDCEDETWERIPAEGWAPLRLLIVH